MITLTTEQAQQIEEALDLAQALLEKSYHHKTILSSYETIRAARAQEQAEQEPVGVVEGSGEWGIAGVLVAGVPIGTKLYAAPQPVTTPDVCGEVCARAKLCYGCNNDLEEANASWMSHDELKAYWSGYGNGRQEALAEQEEQEPVAWGRIFDGDIIDCICPEEHALNEGDYTVPLYPAPQPVQQVDLTDEEELELARSSVGKSRHWLVAAAIAAYKEKNK